MTFASSDLSLGLASFIPLQQEDDGAFAEFALQEEQSTVFVLGRSKPEKDAGYVSPLWRKKRSSCRPSSTGAAGSPSAPTRAAGARWSAARR